MTIFETLVAAVLAIFLAPYAFALIVFGVVLLIGIVSVITIAVCEYMESRK